MVVQINKDKEGHKWFYDVLCSVNWKVEREPKPSVPSENMSESQVLLRNTLHRLNAHTQHACHILELPGFSCVSCQDWSRAT